MIRQQKFNVLATGALLVVLLLSSCIPDLSSSGGSSNGGSSNGGSSSGGSNSSGGKIGQRTKTSGCVAKGALADPKCTPGAIIADATTDQICTPGYSKNVRNVPESVKNDVYAEYGIASRSPGEYEVDHLISLELGGSNDIANLWPEPADPRPGFHEKDKVENYLHQQVCSGAMSLAEAQTKIANDWLSVYQSMK